MKRRRHKDTTQIQGQNIVRIPGQYVNIKCNRKQYITIIE